MAEHPRWGGQDFRLGQCTQCRHYRWDGTCEAFPQGIPPEILADYVSHKKPVEGDQGIRWEAAPKDTTRGRVTYARIFETTPDGWDCVGAIWLGRDGSCSFLPAAKYSLTERSFAWLGRIRASWQLGQSPKRVFEHWSTYDNGVSIKAGRVEEADSLDVLRRRLAPKRSRIG